MTAPRTKNKTQPPRATKLQVSRLSRAALQIQASPYDMTELSDPELITDPQFVPPTRTSVNISSAITAMQLTASTPITLAMT
ncbi:hypothetical protein ATN37_00295 [Rhodococcus sp. MH15]|nr:hypothetical protein [Rhodococcus sp. MH15]